MPNVGLSMLQCTNPRHLSVRNGGSVWTAYKSVQTLGSARGGIGHPLNSWMAPPLRVNGGVPMATPLADFLAAQARAAADAALPGDEVTLYQVRLPAVWHFWMGASLRQEMW